jgi:adenylate cyclase
MRSMDWAAEGLLDGLEDQDARAARVRLLDKLSASGVTVAELRAAVAQERLVLLPIERALASPARYTLAELRERAGTGPEETAQRLGALGVSVPEDPEAKAFGDDDVAAVARVREYTERGIDLEEGVPLVRLMSGLMARIAEPMRSLFAQTYLEAGAREDDLGLRYGERAAELMPLVAADAEYLLRMHLREFARSDAVSVADRASGRLRDSFEVAVAFVDIVGFTALGEELPETELPDVAGRLEALADEHVRTPARVVKTIGDAVMIVSRDPAAAVAGVAGILMGAEADDGPQVRAGVAYGRAVARLGDWYGPPVNLAARLTARARPGSLLVTNAVREALGEAAARYSFSEAGMKRFKGIADPVPVLRLRPSPAAED